MMNKIGAGLLIIIICVFTIMILIMGVSEAINTVVDGVAFLIIGFVKGFVGLVEFLLELFLG